MKTTDLASHLDRLLHLDRFDSDDFAVIVDACREAGIPIEQYATARFLQRFNGLVRDNTT